MIDINKQYRTKAGLPARILCTDAKGEYTVVVLVSDGDDDEVYRYTPDLKYYSGFDRDEDLVEVSPYEDFKIDDKVLVWDYGEDDTIKLHFAGVNNVGKPLAWRDGETSFTTTRKPIAYTFCKKYVEGKK